MLDVATRGEASTLFLAHAPHELAGLNARFGGWTVVLPHVENDPNCAKRMVALRGLALANAELQGGFIDWPTVTRDALDLQAS